MVLIPETIIVTLCWKESIENKNTQHGSAFVQTLIMSTMVPDPAESTKMGEETKVFILINDQMDR